MEIHPGMTVWTPDGEEHWHGAAHHHFMTHLSLTEGPPTWGDHVTAAEYEGRAVVTDTPNASGRFTESSAPW